MDDPDHAQELGDGVRMIKQNRGVFDTAPLSIMGSRTVKAMGGAATMVNVNPDTGERGMPILKQLGREREACLGVYGATVTPGAVRVGDLVSLPPVAR